MLEVALLGLLKDQDMHGYELKRRLQEILGPQAAVSFGSLYPALAKLEAAGAIEVVAEAPESDAPRRAAKRATLLTRRRRKVYRLTPSGLELFGRLLAEPSASAEDDVAFNSRLAFAAHLGPEQRLSLLERRRRVLAERLARVDNRAKRADKYLGMLAARERETLVRDLSWTDLLISEERSSLAGGGQAHTGIGGAGQAQTGPAGGASPVPLASASQLRRGRTPAPAT